MNCLKLICFLLITINLIEVCLSGGKDKGSELIIVGGKCGPRLVMKTHGKKKKKGMQDILLIGPECKEERKKEKEIQYIPVPMPMHMPMEMHGMHGGWRKRK